MPALARVANFAATFDRERLIPIPVNLGEYAVAARERLAPSVYDYYAGGAGDEITLEANRRAFDALALRYRVLRDVSRRDLSTTVLGQRVRMPILVAPAAFQGLAHPDGEVATARAVGEAGSILVLSTLANRAVEEVRQATAGPLWFQLYVQRDRGRTRATVERAVAAGCSALVLTVDTPVLGRRERDVRNNFRVPDALPVALVAGAARAALAAEDSGSALAAFMSGAQDPSLSWRDLEWLRAIAPVPLLLKGVVRGDDARTAAEAGVAGLIVSNHGGRQLDSAVPSIRALPEVADAVGDRVEVLVDGGVRRGTDVVKAIALGARAVLIARPVLWGLALDGQAGVAHVLSLLRDELDLAMALCGCAHVGEITRDLVV